MTLNSLLSSTTVNTLTAGYQYWNNLIASNISAPLVTFPDASFGTNTNVPQQSWQRKWQFRDDISKTIGKHTLKAGVDFIEHPAARRLLRVQLDPGNRFRGRPERDSGRPETYPQKFATPGAVTGMAYANGNPYFLVATKQLGLYFQDDWKVSPRLTLNLGLRWDKDYNMVGVIGRQEQPHLPGTRGAQQPDFQSVRQPAAARR